MPGTPTVFSCDRHTPLIRATLGSSPALPNYKHCERTIREVQTLLILPRGYGKDIATWCRSANTASRTPRSSLMEGLGPSTLVFSRQSCHLNQQLSLCLRKFIAYQLKSANGLALSTNPIVAVLDPCSRLKAFPVSRNSAAF